MRLQKLFYDNDKVLDYGLLTEKDIKAQTKGFKEISNGVYTRKNCKYFYIVI